MTTLVTIHGTGFKGLGFELGPTLIHVGPGPTLPPGAVTNVTNVTVVSDSQITCRLPASDPSWPHKVDMWVTTPLGTVHKANAFEYDPHFPLRFDSIDPVYGSYLGGESVTIRGRGFLGAEGLTPVKRVQLLRFGEIWDFTDVVVVSDTELTAVTPGTWVNYYFAVRIFSDAEVAYLGNPALMNSWTTVPPGIFGDVTPNTGTWSGGQAVTMRRFPGQPLFTTLTHAYVTQDNGGTLYEISFTVVNADTITWTMPNANTAGTSPNAPNLDPDNPGVNGGVSIFFKNALGVTKVKGYWNYQNLRLFTVTDPVPEAGGDVMTLSGWALDTLSYVSIFDLDTFIEYDVTASLVINSDVEATIVTPDLTGVLNGQVYIKGAVEDVAGLESATQDFTVYRGLAPVLLTLTPAHGPYNFVTSAVLTGANFAVENDVSCDTYDAANQTTRFSIYDSVHQSIGQSFALTSGNTLKTARFNLSITGAPTGNVVAKLYAIDPATTHGVDALPIGAALAVSDPVDVSTLTADPTYALVEFAFTGANRVQHLSAAAYIIAVEYTAGDVADCVNVGVDGTTLTHAGNLCNLNASWTADSAYDVVFDLVTMKWLDHIKLVYDGGGPTITNFTVLDDNTADVVVGDTIVYGTNRGYDVELYSGYGTGVNRDVTWVWLGAPVVITYSPSSGPAAGGTLLTIQVNDSTGCIGAKAGGVDCTGFVIIDATHVQALTGPHAPGEVDVHVINGLGESNAGAGFTYV